MPPQPTAASSDPCTVVTSTSDSGANSLRDAIACAADGDTITFDATFSTPQTITLTSGALNITKTLVISGPGAELLTISAGNASRVFTITANSSIYGVTVRDGRVTGHGGAIFTNGALTLSNTHVLSSSANGAGNAGGGIYSDSPSTLVLINSVISGNVAVFSSGGFFALGPVILTDSVIARNVSAFTEGAFLAVGDTTIRGSQIVSNTAAWNQGGFFAMANLTLVDSVVERNVGNRRGGFLAAGSAWISNTRILSNTAKGEGSGGFEAGAATITNSEIAYNRANHNGGGFEAGTATIVNSEIAYNRAQRKGGGFSAGTTVITSTRFTNNFAADWGGGFWAQATRITDSQFFNNASSTYGGGFLASGALTMTNSLVMTNTAGSGGGFWAQALVAMTNTTVASNTATGLAGGLHSDVGVVIVDSTIERNVADSRGGFSTASTRISGTRVLSNTALQHGGGFYSGALTDVRNSVIAGNTAKTGDQGAFQGDGVVTIVDSVLERNVAGRDRGGFYAAGAVTISGTSIVSNTAGQHSGGFFSGGALSITNSQIVSNTAGGNYGGFDAAGTATIVDSTLAQNVAASNNGAFRASAALTVTGSQILSNSAAFNGGFVVSGTANIIGSVLRANTASNAAAFTAYAALRMRDSSVVSNTSSGDSGGVSVRASFAITSVEFLSNTAAGNGGGLYLSPGVTVTGVLSDVTFADNYADANGGAIYFGARRTVLQNSTLRNNTAFGNGGAIYVVNNGSLTADSSVILTGNVAIGMGGALFIADSSSSASISGLTLRDNVATRGGAIASFGTLTLTNATLAHNEATVDGGALLLSGTVRLLNVTVFSNSAPVAAGVVFSRSGGALHVINSLFTGPAADQCASEADAVVTSSHSLATDPDCGFTTASSVALAPLGDHGGSQPTAPLLPGSPALDAADPAECPATDQRSLSRVDACDIGAYESRGFRAAFLSAFPQTTTAGSDFPSPFVLAFFSDFGEPLGPGAVLSYTGPASGAGLTPSSALGIGSGDDSGVVTLTLAANSLLGSYPITIGAGGILTTFTDIMTNVEGRALTVTLDGDGRGSVSSSPAGIDCGITCSATFLINSVVTLTASPAPTATFTGWSGDCSGTDPCPLTLSDARAVTATFLAKSTDASLSALVASAGTLSPTFSPSTTLYSIDLPNDVSSFLLTPTVAVSGAVYVVAGPSGNLHRRRLPPRRGQQLYRHHRHRA